MPYTPQGSTVFINHVVSLQHTDTGRKTDFRRKVTTKIGVTTQNLQNLAHNIIQSLKLTLRQLQDKLPNSSKIKSNLFQIYKEDGTTTYTELRGRHMYVLNAKYIKKTFEETNR